MQRKEFKNRTRPARNEINYRVVMPMILAVCSLTMTFVVSASALEFVVKVAVFVTITVVYVALTAIVLLFGNRAQETSVPDHSPLAAEHEPAGIFPDDVEEKLLALDEANIIFGASLKPSDMFRLISNRVNEIIPFSDSAIFFTENGTGILRADYAFGKHSSYLKDVEITGGTGLISDVHRSKTSDRDNDLRIEKSLVPIEIAQELRSAVACPLLQDGESYGVFVVFSEVSGSYDERSLGLIDAVGSRIAPLFANSINFERSMNNAMIDSLTALPNERALFFVLENQIAESQRVREQRPLTVVSIDISGFSELNRNYGHVMGDRILRYAADNIKGQLRQMDFLARVAGDEFLAVLPTSTKSAAEMIESRIRRVFETEPFFFPDGGSKPIELHFGVAEFLADGETAEDLLKIARIRKRELKSPVKKSILWFPKEHLN